MALQTDDIDIRDVRLHVELGGNGDFYISLFEMNKPLFDRNGKLIKQNTSIHTRISTSGGKAPSEVKIAVAELYRALEKHGLNQNPLFEEGLYE